MKLLPSQKDQIYDSIIESGFSPSQFEFIDDQESMITMLIFKNTDYFFHFESSPKNREIHICTFSPGEQTYIENQIPGSWELQFQYVKKWLTYLEREIGTSDKWKRLQDELIKENITYTDKEEKFTPQEYETLLNQILLLKDRLKSLDLLPEQLSELNSKIDHVGTLANTLNKKDWIILFMASI